jgi:hypothetical protein
MWPLIYVRLLKYIAHIKQDFPTRGRKMKQEIRKVNKMLSS